MTENDDNYARSAARLLAGAQSVAATEPAEARPDTRRDAVVAAMALAIARQARRRRVVRGTAVVLAAAASLIVGVGLARKRITPALAPDAFFVEHESGADNLLVRGGTMRPLLDFATFAAGDSLRSGAAGRAVLAAGNGTRLSLAYATHLYVDELGPTRRFSLREGRLDAKVAKLGPGERFVVQVPEGEVEVRGTVFTVAVAEAPVACPGVASLSTVSVTEGAVAVRFGTSQRLLYPGESWSAPCPDARPSAVAPPPAAKALPVGPPAQGARRHVAARAAAEVAPRAGGVQALPPQPGPVAPPAAPGSSLAEQNNLFQAALAAERQEQTDVALRKLDELLARFGNGPLAESARVERARIVAGRGPSPNP
jgi:ferric-dicitrate binding protein FerR (iron transport regulator)